MNKISIITINRNNADGLRKTIESVVSQTYTDFEYIVIDGASTDNSVEIITKYADRFTYWVSEPDKGIFNAMNKGILKTTGEYLLFLNSGDWLVDKDVLFDFIKASFNESFVSGNTKISIDGKDLVRKSPSVDKINFDFFYANSLPHQSTFIKRNVFFEVGFYNEENKIASDWELSMRALILDGFSYAHFDRIISFFDISGISSQNDYRPLRKKEAEEVFKKIMPMWVYKSYARIWDENEFLKSHEIEYMEYLTIKNGHFSFLIKFILWFKSIKRKL